MNKLINGLDVENLNKLLEIAKTEKEKVKELSYWRARIRWLGAFKSRAYIRRHTLDMDEPADLAGVDTAQNAVETLLASLGACISTTIALIATKRSIEIENLEIALEGRIENILVFLGLEKEGNPGFSDISINIYIKSSADEKVLNEIVNEAMRVSPVVNTIARGAKLSYNLRTFS